MVDDFLSQVPQEAEVPCPSCGSDVAVEVSCIITPGSDELRELFAGALNQNRCPQCGASFVLGTPLVFRDSEQHFIVYYMPIDDRSSWREVEARITDIGNRVFAEIPENARPQCRLTFRRRNFIEKIASHRAGLDDRLLEYVKYQLYNRPVDPIDQIRSELLFDFSGADDDKLVFLLFDRETGEPTGAAHLPMEVYHELEEAFRGDSLEEELDHLFPGPYVSVERLFD